MFDLKEDLIDIEQETQALESQLAGACVTFDGRVRNHNKGKDVLSLEYEAYAGLAIKEGVLICQEALQQFPVLEIKSIHRTGHLSIGETAVWIGVLSEHRKEAFEACCYVIDEMKKRVPIWKKEHYVNGDVQWVTCHEVTCDFEGRKIGSLLLRG